MPLQNITKWIISITGILVVIFAMALWYWGANGHLVFYVVLGCLFTMLVFITVTLYRTYREIGMIVHAIDQAERDVRMSEEQQAALYPEIRVLARKVCHMRQDMHTSIQRAERQMALREKIEQELEEQQDAILNVLEDVEEEKGELTEANERMNTILYSIADAVVVIDENRRITMFNDVASKLSGWEIKNALGKKFDQVLVFIDEETGERENFIDRAIQKRQVEVMVKDTALVHVDGTLVPVADSAAPIIMKDGKIAGGVVVFRDVSEARRIDRAKTEFVSLASHQLRTPLTAVRWYGEMLLKGEAGPLDPKQHEYIEKIYESNKRMIGLVGALLNVSRIELGTFSVEPKSRSLKKILGTVIKELQPLVKEKKLSLKVYYGRTLPARMKIDEKLFAIIVQNLVTNAIKYTPKGGHIHVRLKKVREQITLTVQDDGYGIPKAQQSQIFSKMFRADNIKVKETEGTGLGLYLVKSILDEVNGSITFESTLGKGSTFTVVLPSVGMKKKVGTKSLT